MSLPSQHWENTDPAFRDTYWGQGTNEGQNFEYSDIYKNRKAFAKKYKGLYISNKGEPDRVSNVVRDFEKKHLGEFADHIEVYTIPNFGHIIISSPYNHVNKDEIPDGWVKIKPLYNTGTITIAKWIPPNNEKSIFKGFLAK